LVPLLTDPSFRLAPLGEVTLNRRQAVGLLVTVGGQREMRLYFDKATAYLLKTELQQDGPGGKKVLQESYFGDYRDQGGVMRPGKVVGFRDGTRVMDAEVVEVKYFERLDPNEFNRP
jgi:hypothetical protein